MDEHLFIVTYDISDPKRWRAVYGLMNGYGEWLQLSVFQCRLTPKRHAEMIATLDQLIHHDEDHVLIMDLGTPERVKPRVVSLGKATFEPVQREPVIV
ncbi:MAG: CRISPR-associated endonuclease Cas2 [Gammaproteobacteria bacterium]|nr:CRISPR-associated endonuclease Cas2 [Gammaproteobacteria bacterium]